MNKTEKYIEEVLTIENKIDYLLKNSCLPGKRANLELLYALQEIGDKKLFLECLNYDVSKDPTNTPGEFVYACGVAGLGQLICHGETAYYHLLQQYANDTRWRVREGVAFAIQYIGKESFDNLIQDIKHWITGSDYEKRAMVAGLCEPALLIEKSNAKQVLEYLDMITQSIVNKQDRQKDSFSVLRKGLGYGWSVAIAACPEIGKPMFEKYAHHKDKDIQWIFKENMKKKRLKNLYENGAA